MKEVIKQCEVSNYVYLGSIYRHRDIEGLSIPQYTLIYLSTFTKLSSPNL